MQSILFCVLSLIYLTNAQTLPINSNGVQPANKPPALPEPVPVNNYNSEQPVAGTSPDKASLIPPNVPSSNVPLVPNYKDPTFGLVPSNPNHLDNGKTGHSCNISNAPHFSNLFLQPTPNAQFQSQPVLVDGQLQLTNCQLIVRGLSIHPPIDGLYWYVAKADPFSYDASSLGYVPGQAPNTNTGFQRLSERPILPTTFAQKPPSAEPLPSSSGMISDLSDGHLADDSLNSYPIGDGINMSEVNYIVLYSETQRMVLGAAHIMKDMGQAAISASSHLMAFSTSNSNIITSGFIASVLYHYIV
ncbi:hypothetical protein BDF19DRAFT_413757 [Syncephalis fuscata]|nr:hypothetical protein BDF19DRAFT_413757 [Syncephalis fuscata]